MRGGVFLLDRARSSGDSFQRQGAEAPSFGRFKGGWGEIEIPPGFLFGVWGIFLFQKEMSPTSFGPRPKNGPHSVCAGFYRLNPVVSSNPSMMLIFCTVAPVLSSRPVAASAARTADIPSPKGRIRRVGSYRLRPVVSSRSSMMFIFCTAAPEAPLPRLSNRAVTVKRSSLPATMRVRVSFPASALA